MNPRISYYENRNKQSEEYFNNLGQYHNEFEPAIISYYQNGNKLYEAYFIDGLYHNINGPSRIYYKKNGEIESKQYWLNDKRIYVNSDEEFQKYIKRLNIS